MNAIVSGRAGMALVVAEDALFSIHRDRPGERIERREEDLHLLLDGIDDLQFLEDVGVREVKRFLDLATAQAEALHLALIALDSSLSIGTRSQATADLEKLLEIEGVGEHLEKVFYAHPLPASADLAGARASAADRPAVAAFLYALEALQPVIAQVHAAWEEIPTSIFGEEDRNRVLNLAVRDGLFRNLVVNRQRGEPIEWFLLASAFRPTVHRLHNESEFLRSWLMPFDEAISEISPATFEFMTRRAAPTTTQDSEEILGALLEKSFGLDEEEISRLMSELDDEDDGWKNGT